MRVKETCLNARHESFASDNIPDSNGCVFAGGDDEVPHLAECHDTAVVTNVGSDVT